MTEQLRILTVCTGNVCRSPLAEQLLRKSLKDLPGITVTSAGTGALVGHPMDAGSAGIALNLGVEDVGVHRAQQVDQAMLNEADLVLALTRDHRRRLVEMQPRAAKKVFTLREFARLASATSDADLRLELGQAAPGTGLRSIVEIASLARQDAGRPADPADDDVVDPYRQSPEIYELSTAQLVPAVGAVADLIRRAQGVTGGA